MKRSIWAYSKTRNSLQKHYMNHNMHLVNITLGINKKQYNEMI